MIDWVRELTERFEAVGIVRTLGDPLYQYSQYDVTPIDLGHHCRVLSVSVVTRQVIHMQMWTHDGVIDVQVRIGPLKPDANNVSAGTDMLHRDLTPEMVIDLVWHYVVSERGDILH